MRTRSPLTEIRHLHAEVAELKRKLEDMDAVRLKQIVYTQRCRSLGSQMANICYNLSQNCAGRKLDEQHRKTMEECYKAWDEWARPLT